MSKLILNDGTEFEVENYSFPNMLIIKADTETIKTLLEKATTANFKNATIEDNIFSNVIYEGSMLSSLDGNEEITATLSLREMTDMEVVQERLDEQDAALMELAELIAG